MTKSETPDPTPATYAVGDTWAVPAASSSEVRFVAPGDDAYTVVTTPDGHGAREALIVLDRSGQWSAVVSNGDEHSAVAK